MEYEKFINSFVIPYIKLLNNDQKFHYCNKNRKLIVQN